MMLIDTSGFLCYLSKGEQQHLEAVKILNSAHKSLTHNYVLAELVALADSRKFPRHTTLIFIADLRNNPDIEVVWIDEELHKQAVELLGKRLDKNYSLCDAVSFVLMRERRINQALTTDCHFEQEGFQRLLKP